jgi:hypothetical protein
VSRVRPRGLVALQAPDWRVQGGDHTAETLIHAVQEGGQEHRLFTRTDALSKRASAVSDLGTE